MLSGPKSAASLAAKEKYVAAPLATYAPFIIKQSEGALLEDLDGNRFIDFSSGWGCLNVGQRNERATTALKDQIDRYLYTDFTARSREIQQQRSAQSRRSLPRGGPELSHRRQARTRR